MGMVLRILAGSLLALSLTGVASAATPRTHAGAHSHHTAVKTPSKAGHKTKRSVRKGAAKKAPAKKGAKHKGAASKKGAVGKRGAGTGDDKGDVGGSHLSAVKV